MADTRSESGEDVAICACGEPDGAEIYACWRNRTREEDHPLVIVFDALIENVAVDGRDFLYIAFQFGLADKARVALPLLFGPKVLKYAERAWAAGSDHSRRLAYCDLAIHDPDVVRAHYANRRVICGRYGTAFRNAFKVRLPIPSSAIVGTYSPAEAPTMDDAEFNLGSVLER